MYITKDKQQSYLHEVLSVNYKSDLLYFYLIFNSLIEE